jgi:hypothetical protein
MTKLQEPSRPSLHNAPAQQIVRTERLGPTNLAYAVALARELHGLGTFGDSGPAFDWDFCMHTMLHEMTNPSAYFMLANDGHDYVGAVVGHVEPFFFSPKLLGIEQAWYVRDGTPRRAAIGMLLMRGFVSWCIDEKGACEVQSGDIAGIRTVGVDAIYKRLGFTRYGVIYRFARTT